MTDHLSARPDGGTGSNLARGFADFIKRLSLKLGANPDEAGIAAEAAGFVMMALAEGDVCTDLPTLARAAGRPSEEVRALLFKSGVAASDGEERRLPLVCDADGRIYLYRYFKYETQLAQAIVARVPSKPPAPPLTPEIQRFLEEYFAGNQKRLSGRPDRQKTAVELALSGLLTIISGGPGTGKTTIVTALTAAAALMDPSLRIALAAPTGKAAARMEEAIRGKLTSLAPELRMCIPQNASTLHRLLGLKFHDGEFRYSRKNPLPYDLIIIDEASMMDLVLAARLFEALADNARIVLLGDKNQLAAVEAGAVFAELAKEPAIGFEPGANTICGKNTSNSKTRQQGMTDCVICLEENYRFGADSSVGKLAGLVVAGSDRQLADWLLQQKEGDVRWCEIGEGLPVDLTDDIIRGLEPFMETLRRGDPEEVLDAYETFGVLCAIRRGRRGVEGLNEAVAEALGRHFGRGTLDDSPWFDGRPVMITQNDYNLEIFNGDIGIALAGKDGSLGVWFRSKDKGVRCVSPWLLPEHQTAFAITVHKAQGSEFQNVALVLPHQDSPILTRELIYTALTRARKSLSLYGNLDILRASVKRPTVRRGGLAGRIKATVP